MRSLLAAALFSLFLAVPARATTFATDATDLWWVGDSESGWGVNIVQQDDVLFLTFFVYSQGNAPVWYSSAAVYSGTVNNALVYTGPLYQTNGSWFAAAWNASQRTNTQVGSATFSMDGISSATLTYSVSGVNVTKHIQRQTWRANDLNGSYLGAMIGVYSGCPSGNGYAEEPGVVGITHSGTTVTLVASLSGSVCTVTGTYAQEGRMGSFDGPFTCANGNAGTFHAIEVEAGITGLTGRASAQISNSTCTWGGHFGGLRRG